MSSANSSTKRGAAIDDPICGNIPAQKRLRPDEIPRTLEEFAEWLVQLEEVFGPDVRPRQPMTGTRFLL